MEVMGFSFSGVIRASEESLGVEAMRRSAFGGEVCHGAASTVNRDVAARGLIAMPALASRNAGRTCIGVIHRPYDPRARRAPRRHRRYA